MKSNLVKAVLIAGALLLSACSGSGTSTSSCFFSDGCQQFDGRSPNKLNFGGSAIGNNFNEYSSGLLHD